MISQETAKLFLNKFVRIYIEDKKLFGRIIFVNDTDIIIENKRYGQSVRSLSTIDGIDLLGDEYDE